MKKNLIIVFLTIVSFASLTYGYFQKERADEQEAIAEQSRKEAEMQREVAMTNEQKARENEQRARENEQKANEQIAIALKALDEEKEKLIEQFSADKFSNIGE